MSRRGRHAAGRRRSRYSPGCGSWPRAHLVAAARRRRPLLQLAHQVQAWRSFTASSRTSTSCGAGAAGMLLASGADRMLQPGLQILVTCVPGRRGAGYLQSWPTSSAAEHSAAKTDYGRIGELAATVAAHALKVSLRRPSVHQLDVLNTSELHYIKLMHILRRLN